MDKMEDWVTITNMARSAKLPESTARRYVKLFEDFFPNKKVGRMVLYDKKSESLLKTVSSLFSSGLRREQVYEELQKQAPRFIDVVVDDAQPSQDLSGAISGKVDEMATHLKAIADQKHELAGLRDDYSQLRKELDFIRRRSEIQARLNSNYKQAVMALAKLRKGDMNHIQRAQKDSKENEKAIAQLSHSLESMDQMYRQELDRVYGLIQRLFSVLEEK